MFIIICIIIVLSLSTTIVYFTGTINNILSVISVNSGLIDFTLTNSTLNVNDLMPIYYEDYETDAFKHIFTV